MKNAYRSIVALLIIFCVFESFAQYPFESKKDEKLYNKVEELYAIPDYRKLIAMEEDILNRLAVKDDTLSSLMFSFLAEAYLYEMEDLQQARVYYEKSVAIDESIGTEPETIISSYYSLAGVYQLLGMQKDAEKSYVRILEIERLNYGRKSVGYIETSIAYLTFLITSQQYDKAQAFQREIKSIIDEAEPNYQAAFLQASGVLERTLGKYKKSEKLLLDALRVLEENGYFPSIEYVFCLNELGYTYTDMGKLNVVEEAYQRALDILDRLSSATDEDYVTIKSNLASLYLELGEYDKAKNLFQETLESDIEFYGPNSYYVAISYNNLGLNSLNVEKYEEAEDYFEKSVAIFEKEVGTDSYTYGLVATSLAKVYARNSKIEKAEEYLGKSLKSFKDTEQTDIPEYAFALFSAGVVNEFLNNLEKAEEYHEDAANLRKKILGENHPFYALSTVQLAILNWKMKDRKKAQDYYLETFDNYFTQINAYFPVLTEDEKSTFYYGKLKPAFEQFNSFVIKNQTDNKELIELMYNYQLATKGLIFYATSKVRESIINSEDEELISKYETWINQKEQLAKLFSASDMDPDQRNQKIDSLTEISDELESELSKLSSVFADNFAKTELTWKDVRDKLADNEAAVEIIRFRDFDPDKAGSFTDEVFYAALIVTPDTKDHPELVVIRNGKELENKYLSNYRNAIKYQINENYSYRLFWQPIANKLDPKIERVYFSPDGVYNQISIYTLQNPKSKNFILDEIEVQLISNTKDLVASNDDGKSSGASYLFGFPNYNMGEVEKSTDDTSGEGEQRGVRGARGSRGGNAGDLEELSRGGIPRGLRGNMLRYMRSNSLLALLPGTKKEVNLIDSLYARKNEKSVVYLSEEAVEDKIKSLESPRTLHIATHGFFLEQQTDDEFGETDKHVENPLLRSGLILAGANSFIRYGEIDADQRLREDGILTAYEAMNLNLEDTELVILSACETGLGEVKNGEGVYGLQRAFRVAGADAIIMSMWSVDDNATQELMTLFYEEWLANGDKRQAFINAQKRLKDKWKKPYYWGAFVMVGG